ncbi:MAG: NAD(P)H-dependent oxidoreductase [Rhodobacteraceae bacterium]|nr:NAD(P)H-dependent oxidoreductase [Paracoccaceae bacterium]
MTIKLIGLSGSLRAASYNTMLVHEAARCFSDCDFEMANIRFPLFDEDLEENSFPEEVIALADKIRAADAVIITTPEYNKNLSGSLKNALDWLSRTKPQPWVQKPVAIMSTSTGATGGVRAQYSLRHCMTTFNPRILNAPEVMIPFASKAFDDTGQLTDEKTLRFLTRQMDALKTEIART